MSFEINSEVYGSTFYLAAGLYVSHVMLGLLFLLFYFFSQRTHFMLIVIDLYRSCVKFFFFNTKLKAIGIIFLRCVCYALLVLFLALIFGLIYLCFFNNSVAICEEGVPAHFHKYPGTQITKTLTELSSMPKSRLKIPISEYYEPVLCFNIQPKERLFFDQTSPIANLLCNKPRGPIGPVSPYARFLNWFMSIYAPLEELSVLRLNTLEKIPVVAEVNTAIVGGVDLSAFSSRSVTYSSIADVVTDTSYAAGSEFLNNGEIPSPSAAASAASSISEVANNAFIGKDEARSPSAAASAASSIGEISNTAFVSKDEARSPSAAASAASGIGEISNTAFVGKDEARSPSAAASAASGIGEISNTAFVGKAETPSVSAAASSAATGIDEIAINASNATASSAATGIDEIAINASNAAASLAATGIDELAINALNAAASSAATGIDEIASNAAASAVSCASEVGTVSSISPEMREMMARQLVPKYASICTGLEEIAEVCDHLTCDNDEQARLSIYAIYDLLTSIHETIGKHKGAHGVYSSVTQNETEQIVRTLKTLLAVSSDLHANALSKDLQVFMDAGTSRRKIKTLDFCSLIEQISKDALNSLGGFSI